MYNRHGIFVEDEKYSVVLSKDNIFFCLYEGEHVFITLPEDTQRFETNIASGFFKIDDKLQGRIPEGAEILSKTEGFSEINDFELTYTEFFACTAF